MVAAPEVSVPLEQIQVSRRACASVAVIGNPNTGKSTLFNRLTGMRQKTANYPGVTVERRSGRITVGTDALELIDLPGTFSLSPLSTDEQIAVSVLLGRIAGTPRPDAILAVVDATRLYQGLFLLQQLSEFDVPVAIALTMIDAAERDGIRIDLEKLSATLGGIPVYPVVATTGRGIAALREGLAALPKARPGAPIEAWPELSQAVRELESLQQTTDLSRCELERLIIGGPAALEQLGSPAPEAAVAARAAAMSEALCAGEPPLAVEARRRYAWVGGALTGVQDSVSSLVRRRAAVIDWINRPWPATCLFIALMAIVFQAVFAWATPFMDLIDAGMSGLGAGVAAVLPEGAVSSFIVDGVIAGVGSVIIFLPQILILFLFIILMEDTGYLARAAFLVDRAMRAFGLSGQSVIPLLSSFACAVPSIMATRVIPNRRDRIATILAAPFMTCSARLPIYALMIAAFVPAQRVGFMNLQGIVLFGLYAIGIIGGVLTALLLKRTALRGEAPSFVLALPEFRWPDLRSLGIKLLDRVRIFLRRAGTVIFFVAIIVWALAYFPRSESISVNAVAEQAQAQATLSGAALEAELARIDNEAAASHLEQSLLGRAGHLVEPVFRPLGWDWRVSAAVIAGFPAREVVVAVLGTIYALGAEAEEGRLAARLAGASWPDGTPVFTLPMVLGLLLFYAWCLQCAATLAVIRRETNTWRWPIFAWSYMTVLGYVGALVIFQFGTALSA
ncbi:MAG: ferrous iron transport protein B [Gammaproteobacteria bacterium]|jgi:ferrous iron transport protein B